jgi:hypothetical protein
MERTMTDDEIDQLWRDFLGNDSRKPVRLARRDLRNPRNDMGDWFVVCLTDLDGKIVRRLARPRRRETP